MAGRYLIDVWLSVTPTATGNTYQMLEIRVYRAGAIVVSRLSIGPPGSSGFWTGFGGVAAVDLVVGDAVVLVHTTGGAAATVDPRSHLVIAAVGGMSGAQGPQGPPGIDGVRRFATVAARDAAYPAASAGEGAVCVTTDTGTMWLVVSGVWVIALNLDPRFINVSGDTMTGTLMFSAAGPVIRLNNDGAYLGLYDVTGNTLRRLLRRTLPRPTSFSNRPGASSSRRLLRQESPFPRAEWTSIAGERRPGRTTKWSSSCATTARLVQAGRLASRS